MSDNVAAQGEHDRMCPVCVPMPENQCGYCHLIARVREDERANLYTMGQLADRFEESYAEGRKEGYARGLIEGDHGGRREGYRSGYAAGKDAVMTDSYAQAVAEGQRDEREKWSVLIKDRIRDLQSCTKHDDCMGNADILLVILDDYDYGVAREEKS